MRKVTLLFLRHGALMAQPFDLKQRALGGDAFQVAEQVRYEVPQMSAMFSVSENGLLVYQEGQPGYSRLKWFGRAGQDLGTVGEPALYSSPRLSHDGRWVAVEVFEPQFLQGRYLADRGRHEPGQAAHLSSLAQHRTGVVPRWRTSGVYVKPAAARCLRSVLETDERSR